MELIHVIFWAFALVTCASALLVALSPRLIHAVFGLFFCFFGTAGLYVLLGADFLAATQVIIYIGGILVLMIFGVMLTNRITEKHLPNELRHSVVAALLAAAVMFLLVSFPARWRRVDPSWGRTYDEVTRQAGRSAGDAAASPRSLPERVPAVTDTTRRIGDALLGNVKGGAVSYLIPFEVASLVLLIAMLGAASIARKEIR
jgi:NADH-quinone oxidoreductase subunit J